MKSYYIYGREKISTDLHICIVSVLSVNIYWKDSSSLVRFLANGDNTNASEGSFELHFTTSFTIWLKVMSIINKNVFWQFKIWKISFNKIMLQWDQQTFIVFTCINIYTDIPHTHTHTSHTKNKPYHKYMLHANTTFCYLSNTFANQLKGEVTKRKIIGNSQSQVAIKQVLKICCNNNWKTKQFFTPFIVAWPLLVVSVSFLLSSITHDSISTCWSI